ncbi:MAG TPA: LysR family transcriptional regulator [Candidatus Mediterraneibacter ornithocaccae]|uniref:LysR family transcriptional regulator n=1 Tax=Mediterraneibacter glycyrrhizinilyticus TaxID=342942 RepID=UPI001F866493|nr:LysR family transcriptional regulator [Mediterraneibacter glycyrrhizinilyticus]MDN0060377.1 LysR family transcriptional regulator [Mediterraneibacter glycyrrhizinilyticus]HJA20689.1 LysR family transcriptional regulator [Candidatus Mediterraneibacter ornithocaccae]
MLNLLELEQLAAFAEYGTLSKAAEKLNISQPTITRTMQRLEEEFGVPLFERSKNHIALNETGEQAVSYAVQLLKDAKEAVDAVRAFDRSRHTITVSSCAPAPLWRLLPALSDAFPDMTLSSSIKNNASVLEDVKSGHCLLAVLPGIPEEGKIPETYCCRPFMKENLAVCVPPDHVLAGYKEVSFEVLNGYNFLLGTRLGFWDDMCREKMPASRFLVQTDQFTMEELIRESSLPCFVTDVAEYDEEIYGDRIVIPVSDQAAKITFHIVYNGTDKKYAPAFAQLFNF